MMIADIKHALLVIVIFGILYLIIRYNERWREPEVINIRYMFGIFFILAAIWLIYLSITAFIKSFESPPLWAITLIVILFSWGIGAIYTTNKLSNKLKKENKKKKAIRKITKKNIFIFVGLLIIFNAIKFIFAPTTFTLTNVLLSVIFILIVIAIWLLGYWIYYRIKKK